MKLLIANGHLIDPTEGQNSGKNLLIEDGRVTGWLAHNESAPEDAEIFDAGGMIVAPGLLTCTFICASRDRNIRDDCDGLRGGGRGRVDERLSDAEYDAGNDSAAITRYMIEQAERAGWRSVPVGRLRNRQTAAS
jgi:hypothetical protein